MSVRKPLEAHSWASKFLMDKIRSMDMNLIMPTDKDYEITQGFGPSPYPDLQRIYEGYGLPGHNGIDLGTPTGTPLYALDGGKITVCKNSPNGYGLHLKIDHGDYSTVLAHMSEFVPGMKVGRTVVAGYLLGYSGASGRVTGPHLHLGVRFNAWKAETPDDPWKGWANPLDHIKPEIHEVDDVPVSMPAKTDLAGLALHYASTTVHMRKDRSTNQHPLGMLYKGTPVKVEYVEGSWASCYVRCWVYGDYLKLEPSGGVNG